MVRGPEWVRVLALATAGVTLFVQRIKEMGLRVTLDKMEALWMDPIGSHPMTCSIL